MRVYLLAASPMVRRRGCVSGCPRGGERGRMCVHVKVFVVSPVVRGENACGYAFAPPPWVGERTHVCVCVCV